MPMIKCPECGKEISDKAAACPNCGCPIKKSNAEFIKQNTEEMWEKDDNCVSNEESPVSIISLVCYVSGVIFSFINIGIAFALGVIAIILAIVASCQTSQKDTCAAIVLWINIIGFGIAILAGIAFAFLS